jgi:Fanconi anemia group I protein
VEHSKCGWDHVVEGLVMLGFHLMDTCAPKTSNPQLSSPQYRVCSLGSRILCRCFKVHSIVHGEVISQLINRILTNASTYVTHYIALLSEVIEMTPQVALDSLPRLREAFSYLSVLPPSSATDLLDAVLPLVQFSSSVRDSLLLVLRKSLFSRSPLSILSTHSQCLSHPQAGGREEDSCGRLPLAAQEVHSMECYWRH